MTAFRIFVIIFALIPLFFGVTGIWQGAAQLMDGGAFTKGMDNQFRYLSGVYIGIAAMLFYVAADVKKRATLYRAVVYAVFIGGCARAVSYLLVGPPPPEMIAGMVLELLVPLTLVWMNKLLAKTS